VFVHLSEIESTDDRSLEVNRLVEVELARGPEGAQATRVRAV
jgi:cold shock CspA family protein